MEELKDIAIDLDQPISLETGQTQLPTLFSVAPNTCAAVEEKLRTEASDGDRVVGRR